MDLGFVEMPMNITPVHSCTQFRVASWQLLGWLILLVQLDNVLQLPVLSPQAHTYERTGMVKWNKLKWTNPHHGRHNLNIAPWI